jgi:hypothetical protein
MGKIIITARFLRSDSRRRREFKEDRLVNTATKHLLAYLFGIAVLEASAAHAQQMYVPRAQVQAAVSHGYSAVRVAQQPGPAQADGLPAQPDATPGQPNPAAPPNGAPPIAAPTPVPDGISPTKPGPMSAQNGAPTESITGFPGLSGTTEPAIGMPAEVQGAESALWDHCEPGDCCSVCGGGYCQPPLWYTDQEARIIMRTRPRRVTVNTVTQVVTSPLTGQQTLANVDVLNTRSVNYDIAPGYYATVGRYLGRDSQGRDDFLEFNYWGMNTWVASNFFNGTRFNPNIASTGPAINPLGSGGSVGDVNSPFPQEVVGFNRANTATIKVNSEFHNFELDFRMRPRGETDQLVLQPNGRWRRECRPGTYMSYLAGLRYMTIGDGFLWHTSGRVIDTTTGHTPNIFTSGNYNVQTENDLLGLQIGADMIFRRCKWNWGVHAKLGPYVNFARCLQEINNSGAGDPFGFVFFNDRFNAHRQKVALIGEVGFEANYKFTPTLTGRVAYDFMWINGLALAPEQLQFTTSPEATINTNGGIFSQGLTLGLDWAW